MAIFRVTWKGSGPISKLVRARDEKSAINKVKRSWRRGVQFTGYKAEWYSH